jgi:hypothetical protein
MNSATVRQGHEHHSFWVNLDKKLMHSIGTLIQNFQKQAYHVDNFMHLKEQAMFWIGGVWDERLKHRFVGFLGILFLFLVAYFGAASSGAQFFSRILF